jgi:hypothetical protein
MMRGLPLSLCAAAALMALHAPAQAAPRLSEILVPAMLDVPVATLEAKVGRSEEVFSLPDGRQAHYYAVQGCGLTAYVRNNTVEAYKLSLSADCTMDLSPFVGARLPSVSIMTLENLAEAVGPLPAPTRQNFRSLCISGCGNAADPTVEYLWRAPSGPRPIEVKLTYVLASGAAGEAGDNWQRAVERAESKEYVEQARFNCDDRHQAAGFRLFNNVDPNEITIGRGVRDELPLYAALCR